MSKGNNASETRDRQFYQAIHEARQGALENIAAARAAQGADSAEGYSSMKFAHAMTAKYFFELEPLIRTNPTIRNGRDEINILSEIQVGHVRFDRADDVVNITGLEEFVNLDNPIVREVNRGSVGFLGTRGSGGVERQYIPLPVIETAFRILNTFAWQRNITQSKRIVDVHGDPF